MTNMKMIVATVHPGVEEPVQEALVALEIWGYWEGTTQFDPPMKPFPFFVDEGLEFVLHMRRCVVFAEEHQVAAVVEAIEQAAQTTYEFQGAIQVLPVDAATQIGPGSWFNA